MKITSIALLHLSFLVGVQIGHQSIEHGSLLLLCLLSCLLLISVELIRRRRARHQESFQGVIDHYLLRHQQDLAESGAHIL